MFPLAYPLLFVLLGALSWWILPIISPLKRHHKLPPGPRGLPIIGSLHTLGALPHRTLQTLAKKYGPIMSMRLGSVPTIVVSSPQAAELFLKTHDNIFASRPKLQAAEYMSYGTMGMSFTAYGPHWRNIRKFVVLELLTPAKINSFVGMRREELGTVVKSIKEASAANEVVDLSAKVANIIENMTYRLLLGRTKDDRYDLKGIMNEALTLAGRFNIADFVPFLGPLDIQGLTRQFKDTGKRLDKILEFIIDEHEQNSSNGNASGDFIDDMLSLKNKPSNTHDELSKVIDRSVIKAIMIDIISAAIDTSDTSIEWILTELIKHPRAMKKCQEEIDAVVGVDRMVEETDLPNLEYVYMVVKEGLRLHPVAPLLGPHESMEDITINGYFIPKQSRVIVNSWALGRDPNVWSENAEEFLPERFEGSNVDVRGRDFQLLPFGSGRRGCPGMQLGLITVQLVVARLVHCFDWNLPNGTTPDNLDMTEKFGLTTPRVKHLLAVPKYRL
uniref:Cytochrome P450 CYP736A12 n=1 Tax=Panax ginseng TaxID=4054 RepID=C7A12_PANGI|nr:RecName: Full=Cytochrome P450 CYP736A12 [Panax ginseng]AEY75215.1 cytochrome P450 CYP736A12 [Panax ginseng]